MKKFAMAAAMFLIAMMSLGSVTAFAAEVPEAPRPYERPAFSDKVNAPKGGIALGMMRNGEGREKVELTDEEKAARIEAIKTTLAEKLASGEITQEQYDGAIAKIEVGGFPFMGKGFSGMNGKKPENMGDFKAGMPAFDGKNFKGMKECLGEGLELTAEQKAALMENIKSSLGDGFPAGKLMMPKMAAPGMMNGKTFKAPAK